MSFTGVHCNHYWNYKPIKLRFIKYRSVAQLAEYLNDDTNLNYNNKSESEVLERTNLYCLKYAS